MVGGPLKKLLCSFWNSFQFNSLNVTTPSGQQKLHLIHYSELDSEESIQYHCLVSILKAESEREWDRVQKEFIKVKERCNVSSVKEKVPTETSKWAYLPVRICGYQNCLLNQGCGFTFPPLPSLRNTCNLYFFKGNNLKSLWYQKLQTFDGANFIIEPFEHR